MGRFGGRVDPLAGPGVEEGLRDGGAPAWGLGIGRDGHRVAAGRDWDGVVAAGAAEAVFANYDAKQ